MCLLGALLPHGSDLHLLGNLAPAQKPNTPGHIVSFGGGHNGCNGPKKPTEGRKIASASGVCLWFPFLRFLGLSGSIRNSKRVLKLSSIGRWGNWRTRNSTTGLGVAPIKAEISFEINQICPLRPFSIPISLSWGTPLCHEPTTWHGNSSALVILQSY